jgi:hypothetical protein
VTINATGIWRTEENMAEREGLLQQRDQRLFKS